MEMIKQLIADNLGLSTNDIEDDMHLISELDYDEISFLDLILEIEELLDIELDDLMLLEIDEVCDCFFFEDESIIDDEIQLITVKDLILYIMQKM